ncbi:MAG: cation:proton antiporter [Bacteroidales bacterium]|nr:cation:proton antiporter [Bacteroidales bacterium]
MILGVNFSLPFDNPVLIFSLILFIILFAPILLNKIKVPHLIGLIIAGTIIGENGFNLLVRDSSIVLFGTVGLLYIMFLAGVEISITDFKKNSFRSLTFGMYTFLIPMIIGTLSSYYLLHFSLVTSVLIASMYASHTLIAYPIISKLGVTKNRAVAIAVGGTLITDTLALLVLAFVTGMYTGFIDNRFWIKMFVSVVLFITFVVIVFPFIARWFFKRIDDNISQFIFVLAMVFFAAFLAQVAGVEPIIGAFLAGLTLNRLIPRTSPLMNRIEFVGNALFIPFLLIGVGMLIDFKIFFQDLQAIYVAIIMTVVATVSKFLAAWMTQKTFRFNVDERRLIFGLSNARVAATLAAVLVGYNIILGTDNMGEPIRLLNDHVLNGSILMILVTCTIASFAAQKGSQNIAALENLDNNISDDEDRERILIPISNIHNVNELVNLSLLIKSKLNKRDLFALNVICNDNADANAEKKGREILENAAKSAAASDVYINQLLRYDLNIINSISSVVKENRITDLIIGVEGQKGISENFFGNLTDGILSKCNTTTYIYKAAQPLATIKRFIVIVPERAEKEIGFLFWLIKLWNIAKSTGANISFFGNDQSLNIIRKINTKHPVEANFSEFSDWNDFLIISREVKIDDCLIIGMSRKEYSSYSVLMQKIPYYLNKYFEKNSYILIYPVQSGISSDSNISIKNASVLEPLKENLSIFDDFVKNFSRLFKQK